MVCIVEEADATLSDVSYLESDVNRFYFHSGVDSTALISFSPAVGVESRLFCRITDLGIPGNPVYEYVGDSFVVRYTSISLEYLARQNATVTFTLLPKGLYPVFKTSNGSNGSNEPNEPNELNEPNEPNELNELNEPNELTGSTGSTGSTGPLGSVSASSVVEKGLLQVECKEQPLFTSRHETKRISIPPGPLPLQFTVLEDPSVNYQLQCAVYSVQPGRPRRALLSRPLSVVVAPISSEAAVLSSPLC